VIEIRGITLPVIAIRVKETGDLDSIKEEIRNRVRGKLFQGSYFIIENAEDLPEDLVRNLEDFFRELNLESIKKIGLGRNREHSESGGG